MMDQKKGKRIPFFFLLISIFFQSYMILLIEILSLLVIAKRRKKLRYNRNSIQKLVAGNSVYCCLSWWTPSDSISLTKYRKAGFSIRMDHVILQGKKLRYCSGSYRLLGKVAGRTKSGYRHIRGSCYLNDLLGTACFSTQKQAKKFIEDNETSPPKELIEEALFRSDYFHIELNGEYFVDAYSSIRNSHHDDQLDKAYLDRWCYFTTGKDVSEQDLKRINEYLTSLKEPRAFLSE